MGSRIIRNYNTLFTHCEPGCCLATPTEYQNCLFANQSCLIKLTCFLGLSKRPKTINQFFGNFDSTWQTTFFSKGVWVPLSDQHSNVQKLGTTVTSFSKSVHAYIVLVCWCLLRPLFLPWSDLSSFPQPGPKTIGTLWEFRVPRTNRQSKRLEKAFHQRTCNHEPPAVI